MVTEKPNISPTARLNITQAAQVLGVSRDHIYDCLSDGRLRSKRRVGGKSANPNLPNKIGRPFIEGKYILAYWNSTIGI